MFIKYFLTIYFREEELGKAQVSVDVTLDILESFVMSVRLDIIMIHPASHGSARDVINLVKDIVEMVALKTVKCVMKGINIRWNLAVLVSVLTVLVTGCCMGLTFFL